MPWSGHRRAAAVLAAALLAVGLLAACSGDPAPRKSAVVPPSQASPAAPSPLSSSAPSNEDWPTYHRDNARAGVAPDLPAVASATRAWQAKLDGAVYGQPLVVGRRVLAATENDIVYALDP